VNKKEQNLLIIVIIVIVGATAIIVSLAVAAQQEREFEQQYALKQFFGGMNFAYGQQLNNTNSTDVIKFKLNVEIVKEQLNALEEVRNYCFQHASDPNPIQDLIDKGFLPESFTGETCKSVKVMVEKLMDIVEKYRTPYEAYLIELAMNNTKFNNCLDQKMSVVFCYDTYIGNRPPPRQ
jgi:hypothetical protein